MSNRHRSSKQAAPVPPTRHPARTRRAENRRVRHQTHEMLAHADTEIGEDIVPPRPHHTRVDIDPEETGRTSVVTDGGREFRHWKQKFWKRRTNVQRPRRMARRSRPSPKWGRRAADPADRQAVGPVL